MTDIQRPADAMEAAERLYHNLKDADLEDLTHTEQDALVVARALLDRTLPPQVEKALKGDLGKRQLADRLSEYVDHPQAGTPMVPLHQDTVREIVAALKGELP